MNAAGNTGDRAGTRRAFPGFGDYDLFFQRLLGEETFDYATYPVVDDEIMVRARGVDDAQIGRACTSAEITDCLKAH